MNVSPAYIPEFTTLAELLEQLGGISPSRIRMVPPPGTATEEDVLRAEGHAGRVCELIDGVLVEKTMGYVESLLAGAVLEALRQFVRPRGLGIVLGADGTLETLPHQVRIPDVCFVSWERFPGRQLPRDPVPRVAPDLAVEILSAGNTEARDAKEAARLLPSRDRPRLVHRSAIPNGQRVSHCRMRRGAAQRRHPHRWRCSAWLRIASPGSLRRD